MKTNQSIAEVDFFKEVDDSQMQKLVPFITTRKFKKGTIISKPGDRGLVYIMNKGRVELYEISENGKKFIYSILKRGRIFGDFDLDIPPTFYAEVIEDAELNQIKSKEFMNLILNEPHLFLKLFKYFFMRLLVSQKNSASIATDDVMSRLVKLLVHLGIADESGEAGEYVTDKYTHEQLSQMLGVSRQTITTMLNLLKQKGILKRKKKSFMFNKEELLKIAK